MIRKAFLVFALIAGSSLAVVPAASARPLCVGTQATVIQCVDPTGGDPIEDCVYTGGDECIPVSVPTPYVYCVGGDIGEKAFSCP
jgi:hypothetical protein